MNVVDYVILGIVGISFLFGLYRGFVTSVLGLAAVLAAMGVSLLALRRRARDKEAVHA